MRTALYIARRYLFARKSHNVINVISLISAAGMAIGAAALILILSVYNGFDGIIRNNMSDLDPDLRVQREDGRPFSCSEDFSFLMEADGISTVSTILEAGVFVDYGDRQSLAKARGVDYVYEDESPIKDHIRSGKFSLHRGDVLQCVVGAGLAYELKINPTFVDRLDVYYPDRDARISMSDPMSALHSVTLSPSGIFSLSSDAGDDMVILPLDAMRELMQYKDEASALEVRFEKMSVRSSKALAREIRSHLPEGFSALDRYQQNPAIYKMMRYEKAAIFLIMIFIVLIVAFNIYGSLSMLRIEKEDDVQTLRSLGADEKLIGSIFRLEGWMISLSGMVSGLVTGIILTLIQQHFGVIKMPGSFIVNSYPVILKGADILLSALAISLIGWGISSIPHRETSDPRQEA